jgi:hypothetical protein
VAGIIVALAVVGCCIVWRGKQRRRKILKKRQRESGYADWVSAQVAQRSPNPMGPGGFDTRSPVFDSPQSQRPLFPDRSWGAGIRDTESPQSNPGEKAYFSPYSSHYSSPVSASEQIQVVGREWPIDRKGSVGGGTGLGRVPARSRSREKKEREGDRIEMQNVAPVLLHPGHGRGGSLGLTADDAKNGDAL